MTDNYDNWEKLVGAVLRREQFRELALLDSRSSSSLSSSSSSFNLGPISPLPSYHEYAFELPESTSYGERLLSRDHLSTLKADFFKDHGEASRYRIQEVIGEGSSGVVCSAIDTHTGERVAIKKIANVFDNLSDAMQTLREIKLLKLLRHPDLVYTRDIVLPPSWTGFRHSYVVFELMKSDLHEVIRANEDLTTEQHRFFMYQLLRGLKYIHTAHVFHRDLKPKNILANADCKLKICDFGLARVAFNDAPTPIFGLTTLEIGGIVLQSYVCTPAIDIWSIGCIFAEMLAKRPLFCGKNVVHQLDLITDLLGVPKPEALARKVDPSPASKHEAVQANDIEKETVLLLIRNARMAGIRKMTAKFHSFSSQEDDSFVELNPVVSCKRSELALHLLKASSEGKGCIAGKKIS
ncbi:UNVERIFIED_CONTAM: Mitogen-activated protein kinase [Sesamum calycinum]|uniref:Mitogen-activated protein kinase n=1 Tax=Sesamum calycinum TaxID=2727403 RepID=A0AAW2SY06_9LAMI